LRYLLDTNACVDYLTGRYPSVLERIRSASPDDLCISSVVVSELRYGAERSQKRAENHARLDSFLQEIRGLDFDQEAAAVYGRVRARLEEQGQPIGPYDTMIASHALARELIVVTDNVQEFERVVGLRIANWRLTVP
jgi:tRNA(fMet)-specific endonuclease VapC